MKDLPRMPGTRILCPEDCRYRNKYAPFCGYCLPVVMKKLGIDTERRRKVSADENEDSGCGNKKTDG